jgi:hypothetical protein
MGQARVLHTRVSDDIRAACTHERRYWTLFSSRRCAWSRPSTRRKSGVTMTTTTTRMTRTTTATVPTWSPRKITVPAERSSSTAIARTPDARRTKSNRTVPYTEPELAWTRSKNSASTTHRTSTLGEIGNADLARQYATKGRVPAPLAATGRDRRTRRLGDDPLFRHQSPERYRGRHGKRRRRLERRTTLTAGPSCTTRAAIRSPTSAGRMRTQSKTRHKHCSPWGCTTIPHGVLTGGGARELALGTATEYCGAQPDGRSASKTHCGGSTWSACGSTTWTAVSEREPL